MEWLIQDPREELEKRWHEEDRPQYNAFNLEEVFMDISSHLLAYDLSHYFTKMKFASAYMREKCRSEYHEELFSQENHNEGQQRAILTYNFLQRLTLPNTCLNLRNAQYVPPYPEYYLTVKNVCTDDPSGKISRRLMDQINECGITGWAILEPQTLASLKNILPATWLYLREINIIDAEFRAISLHTLCRKAPNLTSLHIETECRIDLEHFLALKFLAHLFVKGPVEYNYKKRGAVLHALKSLQLTDCSQLALCTFLPSATMKVLALPKLSHWFVWSCFSIGLLIQRAL
jgi:hypothetical protein